MKFHRLIISLCLLISSASVFAWDCGCHQPWQIRFRALGVFPKGTSERITHFGGGRLDDFSNALAPEVSLSYVFSDNLVAEFSVGHTRHSLEASGPATIAGVGRVSLVMTNATVYCHMTPWGRFAPYLGIGLNYTFFYDSDTHTAVDDVCYSDSVGFVGQIGTDICITSNFNINLDIKKIYLDNSVRFTKNAVEQRLCTRLNPWVLGIGVGYRF